VSTGNAGGWQGRLTLVTDTIETMNTAGIRTSSGRQLDADVVVTATGLSLEMGGKASFSVDGKPLVFHE
jgi:monooxygenase